MNMENITRVRRLDLNTVLYSGSANQSQGSSAAGHWIKYDTTFFMESPKVIFYKHIGSKHIESRNVKDFAGRLKLIQNAFISYCKS